LTANYFGGSPISAISGGVSSGRIGTGWAAGCGFQYAFTPAFSWKAEYLHLDLGSSSLSQTLSTGALNSVVESPSGPIGGAQINFLGQFRRFEADADAAEVQDKATISGTGNNGNGVVSISQASTSETATGWVAGGGFEIALTPQSSVRTEYLHPLWAIQP
jgi:opacity protein-like surface antigen